LPALSDAQTHCFARSESDGQFLSIVPFMYTFLLFF
jgi:hypothetical protein